MTSRYLKEMLGEGAFAAQEKYYGRRARPDGSPAPDELGEAEKAFIASRDSFYIATVTEGGWPYLQHRGGPQGFLAVLDDRTLAFADLKGNRQLLSTGNLATNDKVALMLMDYPARERLKILGHASVVDAREAEELTRRVAPESLLRRTERVFVIRVEAFDWNCPAYITPRYTAEEVEAAVRPLQARIAELEARLAASIRG